MVGRRMALVAAFCAFAWAQPADAQEQWQLQQQSLTPAGANFASYAYFEGVSADGRHVFFMTGETLVPEDQNAGGFDLYDRHDGTTELISVGPGGNGYGSPREFVAVSTDGERVLFKTPVPLLSGETTGGLYQRYHGTTTRLPASNHFTGETVNPEATAYYFLNDQQLVPEDTDADFDLYRYEIDSSTLTLVSGPGAEYTAASQGYSRDLSRIYFTTARQLVAADTDTCADLYVYANGAPSLVSAPTTGNCPSAMQYLAESLDGSHVVFKTDKVMAPEPCCSGLWERSRGQLHQIGAGVTNTFHALGETGENLYLTSSAQLVPEDTNGGLDLYRYSGGQYALIGGTFLGINGTGSRVYFLTSTALLPGADTDSTPDIYMRELGDVELVTAGLSWDNRGWGWVGVSGDGGRAFFSAMRPSGGFDRCLYSHARYSDATPSTGLCALNSQGPSWTVAREATRPVMETTKPLVASDSDTAMDVYASDLTSDGFPRPKGATPFRVPLVPAFTPCTSPNRTHGAPLAFPSCNPPVPYATSAFIGVGDGDPAPAKSIGSVLMKVLPGASGPPDDSDVSIAASITNVMKTSDRSDYPGELRLELPLRITDHINTPSPPDAATVSDTSVFVTMPCAATADPTIGAACSASTSADAVLPGLAPEGGRSVWELGQVRVHDGGADGDAETPGDNELFAVQGLFAP